MPPPTTMRQYLTSIRDYQQFKELIIRKRNRVIIKTDIGPEKGDRGNFTFRLEKFPTIPIQLTSKRFFLRILGVKPSNFLFDLKVIRELTSISRELYPEGIDFKLNKEICNWKDQLEIISRQNGLFELQKKMLNRALESRESFDRLNEELWKGYKNDARLRNHFAETLNNVFAYALCKNGFRCKTDGTLKFKILRGKIGSNVIMDQFVQIITASGFLDNRD